MDAVAAGLGSDIDDRVADAAGGRIENLVRVGDTDGHRVDENIAIIGLVEIGLAAYGGHAYAIAIAANASDDALDEVLHLRVLGPAKAQRVHIGNRARTHGEHIAEDPADARCRALVGLDIAGMVVALHLEDGGLAITNVDHAGIFAWSAYHLRPLGRQLLKVDARALVGAMLRPHDREDPQFGDIGFAAQRVQDALIFLFIEAMFGNDLGGDRRFLGERVGGHAEPLARPGNFA